MGWRLGGWNARRLKNAEKVLLQASQPSSFRHKPHFQKPHNAGSRPEAPIFNTLVKRIGYDRRPPRAGPAGKNELPAKDRSPHAGGAEVSRRTSTLKSSAVTAQPREWVQQALVAGCTQAILAAADQIRGGLEGLVAEGAFFALHLGPACVSLFASDAFTFHGPAFHASAFSGHCPMIYKPHARRRHHPPRPFISFDCRLLSNASAVVRTSILGSEISIIVKFRL